MASVEQRRILALESLPEVVTLRHQKADRRIEELLSKPLTDEDFEEFYSLLSECSDETLDSLMVQLERKVNANEKQTSAN
ncbi:MAG: hypothetical protein WBP93_14010 [Pyrinomonadaceae bacterium]